MINTKCELCGRNIIPPENIKKNGKIILSRKIYKDLLDENITCKPKKCMDCFEKRFGKLKRGFSKEQYIFMYSPTEEELKEFISTDNVLWKPLYLHDHGGLSMTTSPGCQWDSGCVGVIYITHDQIREQQSIKGELSEKDLALAELGLSCDIERYNAFLTGDTWGIQISQKVNKCNLPYYQSVADNLAEEDWEWIDSCFGLYGDDGLMEFNSAIEQWGSK